MQGRAVRPVGVVDAEQQRLPAGQVGDQPVQAVQRSHAGVAFRAALGNAESGQGSLRGAVENRRFFLWRGVAYPPLQQLAGNSEGEILVELAGARVQDANPALRRAVVHLMQQRRLADPRRALEDDDPPVAVAHVIEESVDEFQLDFSLEEHRRAP